MKETYTNGIVIKIPYANKDQAPPQQASPSSSFISWASFYDTSGSTKIKPPQCSHTLIQQYPLFYFLWVIRKFKRLLKYAAY